MGPVSHGLVSAQDTLYCSLERSPWGPARPLAGHRATEPGARAGCAHAPQVNPDNGAFVIWVLLLVFPIEPATNRLSRGQVWPAEDVIRNSTRVFSDAGKSTGPNGVGLATRSQVNRV